VKKSTTVKPLVFEQKVILGVSLPLILLLILCSTIGLLYPGIYTAPSSNWVTQTIVQDGVNLFIVTPVLIVAALYSFQGIKAAIIMWGGTVGYLAYTFLIYCFSVAFNVLFLGYCLILGLSIFSLAWFFLTQVRHPIVTKLPSSIFTKVTGVYFLVIAVLFYVLWLMDILPASITNTMPASLAGIGLPTNPVQVIDLSIFLPLVFIAGVLTIRTKPLAATLVPVVLVFFVLMDITIAVLTTVLIREAFGGSIAVVMVMTCLGIFSMLLLIWFVRITQSELGD
jgi:hypothetical protein